MDNDGAIIMMMMMMMMIMVVMFTLHYDSDHTSIFRLLITDDSRDVTSVGEIQRNFLFSFE